MKIILPFHNIDKYPLTQKFGEKFLYAGKIVYHQGVDYALPKFTQIIAPFDGKIIRTTPERTTGYGRAIYLQAKNEKGQIIVALMAHLEEISVEVGVKVKQGNKIGLSGRTGFWRGVNGYHVHFGLSLSGKFQDPLPLLNITEVQKENLFNQDDASLKSFLGKYTVVEGDNLWKIAERYYGNGAYYIEIFNANNDILKNPHKIYPGQVFRIPALKNRGI